MAPEARPPLSSVLPALILGTATFNTQYVDDPARMPSAAIVARALELGITGFDTSPYYGPAEVLLGAALAAAAAAGAGGRGRDDYFLITKAGRVANAAFDYSAAGIRASVLRSLVRLHTGRVDLVYAHDAEFVSPAEVVTAVAALRELRAEGRVRYVGLSGFPLDVLCGLAERVQRETGEPVDAVLSYGHCTVQNARLADAAVLARLRAAGVGVVLNASVLNMGLLTARGVDAGPQAAWHPSPPALRRVCARVADACRAAGESVESVAIRYSLDEWARAAPAAGLGTQLPSGAAVGAAVIGVTTIAELQETFREWQSVLASLDPASSSAAQTPGLATAAAAAAAAAESRRRQVSSLVQERLWPLLGEWKNYSWASPPEGWVNQHTPAASDRAKM